MEPAEASAGAWIAPRLGPFGGWVGSVALRELCRVLTDCMPEQKCFFALWEGWGWVDGRSSMWW